MSGYDNRILHYACSTEGPGNKRRRQYNNFSGDEETAPKTKQQKFQTNSPNKPLVSINNFQISPKLFYSKKTTNKIREELSSIEISKTKDCSNRSISPTSRIIIDRKNSVGNSNKKKGATKKIYSNQPRLGNKNVIHKIRRPKKVKVDSGKFLKFIETRTVKNKSDKEKSLKVFDIIVNNSKRPIDLNQNKVHKHLNSQKRFVVFNNGNKKDDIENSNNGNGIGDDNEFDSSCDELPDLLNDYQKSQNEVEETGNTKEKKKFFKSGIESVKNECRVVGNLKITMSKGKVYVLPEKLKKKKLKEKCLSRKHTIISNIINRLSCSPEPLAVQSFIESKKTAEILRNENNNQSIIYDDKCTSTVPALTAAEIQATMTEIDSSSIFLNDGEFVEFRRRIPFNTNNPEDIERQHLLLDFLILHNICNEENFRIFIADPDNHKKKAAEIVDSLTLVVSADKSDSFTSLEQPVDSLDVVSDNMTPNEAITLRTPIRNISASLENVSITCDTENPEGTPQIGEFQIQSFKDDLEIITSTITNANDDPINATLHENKNASNDSSEILISSENDRPNLFPIFYTNQQQMQIDESRSLKRKRNSLKAIGLNQYQIDAGQKEFGAKECPQCGLLYTVHEPEEEVLHMEYHQSLHVLRFKGWNDENVVQEYPEWGPGGRIITITDSSNAKRKERLMNVIEIIDKELGFTSNIFPLKFIAYLAIRHKQIVGVCLVQYLEKANKFICQNGVDCCTEDFYDVKCGISRIWVSSLHRRIGIATKLINAAQLYTIPGTEISLDNIAFSAPTENGKAFARKITKRDDFFVFQ